MLSTHGHWSFIDLKTGGSSTMLCTTLESVNAPPGLKAFTQISVPIPSGFSLKQPKNPVVSRFFGVSWTQEEKMKNDKTAANM